METTTTAAALPQCWQDFHDVIDADSRRVILYGVPATGKTFGGLNIGKPRNAYRLICSEDMTDADIVGCWQPSREGWHWREGMAIKAWREGARLVIDEIDKASGDVLSILLAMTDTVESSSWRNPETGEIVTPHPEYTVVMTTNLEHMGDLPEALTSRFPIRIHIDAPHPDALDRLPEVMRSTASTLATHADPDQRVSMRAFLELARLEAKMGRARAAALIFGNDRAADLLNTWALADVANAARASKVGE
jgi:MoxR-like ATPase